MSRLAAIENNLKELDRAKQLWASDHTITNGVKVTEQDLAAYFPSGGGSNGLVKPVIGELYVISSLGSPVEAQLTRDYGTLPKGTVIRLGNRGVERIRPNLETQGTGANTSVKETNGTSTAAGSRH